MSKKTPEREPLASDEQIVMTGIFTEKDIVSMVMKRLAKRGGSANTPAQHAHRVRAMTEYNQRRKAAKLSLQQAGN